jgi:uncharacterized protein (DUF433 family)
MIIENQHIEYRDGGYRIKGKRVSLDSIIYRWREGLSPESICECYPVLSLREVYGALSFYLDHQAEIDEYLQQAESEEEEIRQRLRATYPEAARRTDELRQLIKLYSIQEK